jgi:hypothetical protein
MVEVMASNSNLGYPPNLGIDLSLNTDAIRKSLEKEIAKSVPTIAKAVLDKLKPEIPGLVRSATDAAVRQLEPQIPRLVNKAIVAAQGKLLLSPKAKAAVAVVGVLWTSAAVFSFLAWRNTRRGH